MEQNLTIKALQSGGIITNYYCTSQCRHCLYNCSPKREKEYLKPELLKNISEKIKTLDCLSVHIGGGEPFLDVPALKAVLKVLRRNGISVEYIETNSSWFKDMKSAVDVLASIRELGVNTLLISMSPFHNEHIPFKKVKGVIKACEQSNLSVFPWISAFYREIDRFDDNRTHNLEEYQNEFGEDYLKTIPSRYWVHFGGRAIQTFKQIYPLQSLESVLQNSRGCRELTDTSHFHIDPFGNYVPGLCSGLAIDYQDLGKPLDSEKYPIIHILFNDGINGLLDYACGQYNFIPEDSFLNKCDLCLEIRKFLVNQKDIDSQELQPIGFYDIHEN